MPRRLGGGAEAGNYRAQLVVPPANARGAAESEDGAGSARKLTRGGACQPCGIPSCRNRLADENGDAYIVEVASLVAQLRRRRVHVTDDDHVQHLINGLSASYSSVVDHLLSPTADRRLDTVEAHIRNVARAIRHTRSSSILAADSPARLPQRAPASAPPSTSSTSSHPSHGFPRRCFRCKSTAHRLADCPVPCRHYQTTGHSEKSCVKKKTKKKSGRSNAIQPASDNTDNLWLVDSGSDFTITPHRYHISSFPDVSDLTARVANGQQLRLLGHGFTTLR